GVLLDEVHGRDLARDPCVEFRLSGERDLDVRRGLRPRRLVALAADRHRRGLVERLGELGAERAVSGLDRALERRTVGAADVRAVELLETLLVGVERGAQIAVGLVPRGDDRGLASVLRVGALGDVVDPIGNGIAHVLIGRGDAGGNGSGGDRSGGSRALGRAEKREELAEHLGGSRPFLFRVCRAYRRSSGRRLWDPRGLWYQARA